VPRQEHDRHQVAGFGEASLELESIEFGHRDIEHRQLGSSVGHESRKARAEVNPRTVKPSTESNRVSALTIPASSSRRKTVPQGALMALRRRHGQFQVERRAGRSGCARSQGVG